MSVDYDLVIIGSSPAGVYAAVKATEWKARVALVEENPSDRNWLGSALKYSQMLNQLGHTIQQLRQAGQFGVHCHSFLPATEELTSITIPVNDCQPRVNLDEAIEWATSAIANYEELYSPAVLASLGIDWIAGSGQFVPKPHLAFEVKNRRLRSRAYLIATGTKPALPDIEGLQTTGYLTPETIHELGKKQRSPNISTDRPPSLTIIGGAFNAIEIAQTFARLGIQVTLVVPESRILPQEDPQAAFLIQAHLEAEGVRVLTDTQVTQARQIEGKKWIQAGDLAIEADEIVLAAGEIPKIATLNLDRVGVQCHGEHLVLNEKLQTTNPWIYACGMGKNNLNLPHLADYEANIALKNALFWPVFAVNDRPIPGVILSDPPLARVGLMEDQARARYGGNIVVLCEYFKILGAAQLKGETTGFCKIIVRHNGEILGACIVGTQADELIHIFALAIQQRMKVSVIASMPCIFPTFAEILRKTAAQWHQQRFNHNRRLQDFLESLFNVRRHWWK